LPTHITRDVSGNVINIKQDPGTCLATYQPAKDNRFRSRLTFSFAIGQAF
jgi:hypothetical protein